MRNVPSPSTQQPVDRPIYAKDVGDDPHLFLDPVLAHVYAETISHSMIIKDGANTPYYDSRYLAYKQQISALHDRIARKISEIPDEGLHDRPVPLVPCDDLGPPGDVDVPEDLKTL